MYFKMLVILLVITVFNVCGESPTKDECAKNLQNEFDKALPDPPEFVVPEEFKDIKELIDITNKINDDIKTISVTEKFTGIEKKLNNLPNTLKLIKDGTDIIKKIKGILDKLQKQKEFNNNTEDTCEKAKEKYEKLSEDLEEIQELGSKLNETIGKLNINKINEESLKIKKNLDKLKIPVNFENKYIWDKNIISSFKAIKDITLNIKNLLELIKDDIQSELQMLTDKLQFPVINENIPEMPITKAQLQGAIKFVKQNLKKAERLRDLLERKKDMEVDLQNIEKIVCNLHKNNVCEIVIPVPVEN